ncbi:MAG: aspartate--tRNA ligase [Clostridia bacterium]|nr:aspartate--tRNA ligase [Clostridia bacterium]
MAEFMTGLKRTGYVHTLTKEMVGKQVTITGWAQKTRNLGSLIFIDLRDRTGIAQLVFDADTDPALFEKAATVRAEFVLAATGVVRARAPEAVNARMITGEIEVAVTELRILNDSQTPPFHIDDKVNVSDAVRLKHRYLDLRRPCMRDMLLMRHRIAKIARDYFDRNGFIEIETPILTKSTPEGARDYLVPSRVHPGKFYALPQSPQIFKQLLMVSGFDRYMQICKCFRDEDLRADRQPEFTQIDLEMSFVDEDDVMTMNEGFLKEVFKEVLDIDVPTPFTRMPYAEAMARFGSDKPDVRFGLELCDISEFAKNCSFGVFANSVKDGGAVRLICAPAGHFTRKEIDGLTEFIKTHGGSGMAWIAPGDESHRSSLGKVLTPEELQQIIDLAGAKTGDLICIVCGKSSTVYTALGALRCHIAEKLNLIPKDQFAFLWITDFPQFEYSEEENRYVAVHHPFTMPKEEDIDKLESDLGNVKAKAYDIVLNGYELGGGSIRIHDRDLQAKMFKALGFSDEAAQERFGFLLDAFKYGTPPHGGMAYGLDRLVMLMAGSDNIRDTIAFPKVQNASCLMSNAPDFVDEKQLDDLKIACVQETIEDGEA